MLRSVGEFERIALQLRRTTLPRPDSPGTDIVYTLWCGAQVKLTAKLLEQPAAGSPSLATLTS